MYAIYLEMRDFSIDLRNITQLARFHSELSRPVRTAFTRARHGLLTTQIHSSHTHTLNGITRMGDPLKTKAGKSSVNGTSRFLKINGIVR